MGFPKERSGISSLWSNTGIQTRGRYNLDEIAKLKKDSIGLTPDFYLGPEFIRGFQEREYLWTLIV